MNFTFTEDQLAFRDAVRDLLTDRCTAVDIRAAWAGASPWSLDRWAALAEMGVLGATVAEDDGGLGLSLTDVILLAEEAGRAALPEPMVETAMVAPALLREAGGEAAEWSSRIASGEAMVALGLTGSDVISGAGLADLVLVRDGARLLGYTTAEWEVEASVDRSRRLGRLIAGEPSLRVDDCGEALDRGFDRGVTVTAAQLVGLARHLIETTVEYAKEREQFGRPIGTFQAVKHHLADALLAVEFAAPAVYRSAWSLANGASTTARDASMAKAMAGDAAEHAARAALQVHGAIGFTFEYDLHLWMKKVWALAADWHDADWHRARVAAAVLDS